MVAQKITCPSRSDDIGNQYINSNTKRHGFFANESKDSQYFESGRNRSFKGRQESAGERSNRRGYTCQLSTSTIVFNGHNQLFRGKPEAAADEYLKPEPLFESTMFHDTDCEFFQDLALWCSAPAKEEQVQTIDPVKVHEPPHTDTIHTQFSPQGWDAFSANSPTAQAGYYPITPNQLSPVNVEGFPQTDSKFLYPLEGAMSKSLPSREQFLDISSLPVVIGDLEPEKHSGMNPWLQTTETVNWNTTHDTDTLIHNNNTMSFIHQEDSTDMKYTTCVIPREVESNNVVIREYLIDEDLSKELVVEDTRTDKRGRGLAVDLSALAPSWPADLISTPEVLSYVEQLEEKDPLTSTKPIHQWPSHDSGFAPTDTCAAPTVPTPIAYEPVTPKSESHTESENDVTSPLVKKRLHDSEDSDETYTPDSERTTPRRYKRRKPNVPLKDMILALEGSQQLTKARRGRPPKRRESNVSSVCSVDENSSTISTQESTYRIQRDKNNEASKRSRMNRKLKELQMEQLVVELEERNKKLKVRAQTLEEMTKRLKEAFMTAILKK